MIEKDTIYRVVEEWLKDKKYFIVDINVNDDDKIVVEIDHRDGVWIEDCAELSRFIEAHLDREKEDYELEVGSAGIGQPFKVLQQYLIHINDRVEVMKADGKKMTGTLKSADEKAFVVTVQRKLKKEGEKRPKMVAVDETFGYDEIKYTKYLISFE